jgi:hypothetical protein
VCHVQGGQGVRDHTGQSGEQGESEAVPYYCFKGGCFVMCWVRSVWNFRS